MSDEATAKSNERARNIAMALFWLSSFLAIIIPAILLFSKRSTLSQLSLSDWGDFLAGAFGPAALLVLSATFLLQQVELRIQVQELKGTRRTLDEQKQQLEISAQEASRQNKILTLQSIIADWESTKKDLEGSVYGIGVLAYRISSTGPRTEILTQLYIHQLTEQISIDEPQRKIVFANYFQHEYCKKFSHVRSFIAQIDAFENRLLKNIEVDPTPWTVGSYFRLRSVLKDLVDFPAG